MWFAHYRTLSMPITHGDRLAKNVVIWSRRNCLRNTTLPRSSTQSDPSHYAKGMFKLANSGGEASRSNRLYRRNAFFNLCDACLAYASYGFLPATLRSYFFE